MFDEPEESPSEQALTPAERAKEKGDEFRMHAELCAVFEANRKFAAAIDPKLDADIARDAQKTIGRLEKAKLADSPLLSPEAAADALALLNLPATKELSTNDYHIHRRPGEVMILRWIEGEQVEAFYTRLQAHFDAALTQYREEERQSHGWKQDPQSLAYFAALDALEVKMSDRYLRDILRKHNAFVLSTQSADEMDILHLCDFIMGLPAAEIVGPASAPPDQPTEQDRAWFFKLFSLRGMNEGREQMCFFTYLQKADDAF
ncbi:MAG: hypothetical protein ABIP55_00945 [Tepidisphaeraceae bacterium]